MNESAPFPYVKARDLTVRYPFSPIFGGASNGYTALSGVNFELRPGSRLGLIGRNGSGKSTLLRTLAGVYPPSSGTLEIRGKTASIFNATSGFVPNATGYENIFLRGVLLGLSFEEMRALAPRIIEFAGIGDWINQPIYRYSSGMTLRLAFAITTAVESDILLMDEWLGAGDADFVKKARARMMELVERASILVLATHNMRLMASVCEEVMILHQSEVLYYGEIGEGLKVYHRVRAREDAETAVTDETATAPAR